MIARSNIALDDMVLTRVFKDWPETTKLLKRNFNLNVYIKGTIVAQHNQKYLLPRNTGIIPQIEKPTIMLMVDFREEGITHSFNVEIPRRLLISAELEEQEEKLKPIRKFDNKTKMQLRFAYLLYQISKDYYLDNNHKYLNELYIKYGLRFLRTQHKVNS